MKKIISIVKITVTFIVIVMLMTNCKSNDKNVMGTTRRVLFLHHSTGNEIWKGGMNKWIYKIFKRGNVQRWFSEYNKKNESNIIVKEKFFPKEKPYGWKNYPFDYYNIWVKHAGETPYMEEPTLEILTKSYNMIIWKHCYPVSAIKNQSGKANINSEEKTIENYKLQYNALKEKMHQFPETKFLVWTGAALVKNSTTKEQAERAREFFTWVKNEWDEKGDNIYIWDFYSLETEGGIYLKDAYAQSPSNSHPSKEFSKMVYPLFCQRIVDVLDGKGDKRNIEGK